MEDERENISKIVMKIIEIINNIGKKIQEFELNLKKIFKIENEKKIMKKVN